jgi:predicted Zn-dependent peptidase
LIGTEATVAGIRQGDVYDFLKRFYIANNVSTSIVGPITLERVMRGFRVFFGGWSKGQVIPTTFRQPAQVAQLRLVKVEAPDAANVELRGGVLGLKHTDPDFLMTEVMARILAARLKGAAEAASANFTVASARRVLSGPFYFSASVAAEKAPRLSQKATEQFAALAATAVSPEELAAAKASLASEYAAYSVEHYLREIEVFKLPRNYPLNIQKRINDISAADVRRVAKGLLDSNALTVVALGRVNDSFKSTP